MTRESALYAKPAAMEPMLPTALREELSDLTAQVLRKAGALSSLIRPARVRSEAARLVREMNSYYSNLIEGHKTLPRDIEKALRKDFLTDATQRANQQLNRAHIQVEEQMLGRLAA